MKNSNDLVLKYLKLFVISALLIFIIDNFIVGNLLKDGKIYEYLVVDIIPLISILFMGMTGENIFKKYDKGFNLSLYFILSAFFIFIFNLAYIYISPLLEAGYKVYAHIGMMISLFFIGIFYIFNKKTEIKNNNKQILYANNEDDNNTLYEHNTTKKLIIEIFFSFNSGTTVCVFIILYEQIKTVYM